MSSEDRCASCVREQACAHPLKGCVELECAGYEADTMPARALRKPLVYIAGPFRAPTPWGVERNVREAEAAVMAMIEASGGSVVPIAPHMLFRHFDKCAPDEYFLAATLEILRMCKAVYVLPGWERSSGTRGELEEAGRLGLIVSEYMTDLLNRLQVATAKLGAHDG